MFWARPHGQTRGKMKVFILYALSIILTVDSVLRFFRSSFNLGTFLMYAITVSFWVYAIFNSQIDTFTSHGVGLLFKLLFFAGVTVVLLIAVFIAIKGFTQKPTGEEDVVIVLGAGLNGKTVTNVLARRLNSAYDFYTENPDVTIVVTGGQGLNEIIPEAHAMSTYLIEKGVPKEQIILEDKSTSTRENFLFAYEILAEKGFEKSTEVAFATNHFHCFRAMQYAKAAGFENVSSIPSFSGFSSFVPNYLREVFAVLYYFVFFK